MSQPTNQPMKHLDIQSVANGWIVHPRPEYYPSGGCPVKEVYVFSTPAQLTLWIEKWSVERRKEQAGK